MTQNQENLHFFSEGLKIKNKKVIIIQTDYHSAFKLFDVYRWQDSQVPRNLQPRPKSYPEEFAINGVFYKTAVTASAENNEIFQKRASQKLRLEQYSPQHHLMNKKT